MGLSNLAKRINGSRVSRGRTCGSRALYTAFSNNKKVVTILHKELERKVEKVTDQSTLIVCEEWRGGGGGRGLNSEGGLTNFLPLIRVGLLEGGGRI